MTWLPADDTRQVHAGGCDPVATHRRSAVKAVSYRLFATSLVFLIAFLFTGELGSSAKIGVSAAVAKTTLYYLWERLWSNIGWGLEG